MPELSIIVPVYRKEQYLKNCIDSVLCQTFEDFELILVDDGSPDRCGEICDEYAMEDERIYVMHQENQGVSAARNAGLSLAKGRYVGFVDPDDTIHPNMYKTLISIIKDKDVDLAICGLQYIDKNNNLIKNFGVEQSIGRVLSQKKLLKYTFGIKERLFYGSLCNKVFKKELLMDKYFNNNVSLFEDWLGLLSFYDRCKSAWITPDIYYYYSAGTDNSLGKTKNPIIIYNSLRVFFKLIPKFKKDKELYTFVLIRFLEDSIVFLKRMERSWRFKIMIKSMMGVTIMVGYMKGVLTKTMFHKYIVEGIIQS